MLFRIILLARLVSFGKDFRRDFKHSDWRLGSRLSARSSQPSTTWLSLAHPSHLFRSRPSQTCSFESYYWPDLSPLGKTFAETSNILIGDQEADYQRFALNPVFRGFPLLTPRTYFAVRPPRHALSNDTTGQTCLLWERLFPSLQSECLKSRRKSFPKETSLASSIIRKSMSGRAYCEIGARGEQGKATKYRVESKSLIIGFLVSNQNV